MIWGDTKKIGCAVSKYNNNNGKQHYYLVCNYGPTGNQLGSSVYEVRKKSNNDNFNGYNIFNPSTSFNPFFNQNPHFHQFTNQQSKAKLQSIFKFTTKL